MPSSGDTIPVGDWLDQLHAQQPPKKVRERKEETFQEWVVGVARQHGWLAHFIPDAYWRLIWRAMKNGLYRVLRIKPDPGYPDLTLCRTGVTLFWELKTAKGTLTKEEKQWIAAGLPVVVWKDSDATRVQILEALQ